MFDHPSLAYEDSFISMVGNVVANSLKLHNLLLFIVFITHKFREELDIIAGDWVWRRKLICSLLNVSTSGTYFNGIVDTNLKQNSSPASYTKGGSSIHINYTIPSPQPWSNPLYRLGSMCWERILGLALLAR